MQITFITPNGVYTFTSTNCYVSTFSELCEEFSNVTGMELPKGVYAWDEESQAYVWLR